MYSAPKTLFQQKLKESVTAQPNRDPIIEDIIKLSFCKDAEKDENLLVFLELYKLLGLELFTETIDIINGKTITFPSRDEFKDDITTVLCYYYRTIEGKEWDDIKSLLGEPDLNSIKFGIRGSSLGSFIDYITSRIAQRNQNAEQ